MQQVSRRELIRVAALLGAALALPGTGQASRRSPRECRRHFPEGVASADPAPTSVILWTRRAPVNGTTADHLVVEIAEEPGFRRVVASGRSTISADTDWTCRFLAAGLRPGRTYWYRFIDEHGYASRTGRTFTAPEESADEPVRFAFVSCQNVNLGHAPAFRRMIEEDARRAEAERIRFVLHLGDFIYEMVWYPEDRAQGMQGRRIRDTVRLPHGEKIGDYHVPSGVQDYRAIYRAYLADPDIQDARAHWPFVCVWDNHEFSNRGWQSQADYGGSRPAQRLKVAANRAWFEYVPARVRQPEAGARLDRFDAPAVEDRPLADFDDHGLARDPNNLAAIHSLLIARALRWGRHVELLLTDNRSFRSQPILETQAGEPFRRTNVPFFVSQEAVELLDFGARWDGGNPPETIRFDGRDLPNPRRAARPGTMLGVEQKAWLLAKIARSETTWTLWGNSVGMLDLRCDPANLHGSAAAEWPSQGYGIMGAHDWSAYPAERAEILNAAGKAGARLVSLVGDRHAFYAGLVSPTLPPRDFTPVAAEFVVGSISTPTVTEAAAASLPADHPLSGLILEQGVDRSAARPTLNITLRHGVRASLAFAESGSLIAALAARNPDVAPHLGFADAAGHGFAVVRADGASLDVDFVAMPAPITPDADKILYRVTHRLKPWARGDAPQLSRVSARGTALADRFIEELPSSSDAASPAPLSETAANGIQS